MKSSYGAVLTDFFFAWGRFNRKWGRFGLGLFSIGAVLTGNRYYYVNLHSKEHDRFVEIIIQVGLTWFAKTAYKTALFGHRSAHTGVKYGSSHSG